MIPATPTVFIVDDDEGARNSVKAIVRSMGVDAETFPSAEEFLAQADPARPGCLVTDLRMLGLSGIELQEKIVGLGLTLPVIIITAHAETPITVRAIKNGALTVLEKPCRDYELYDVIRDAIALDKELRLRNAEVKAFTQKLETLTESEQGVLDLMIQGQANKVVARRLGVSVRTVENRRQQIFEKTGTDSLAELIRLVVQTRSNSAE
jgi:two-component system, LuxR family, response regulator FixJ